MKRILLATLVSLSPLLSRAARAQDNGADLPPPPPPPDDSEAQAPPPAPDAQPPAQAPSEQTFEQQLSPYGRWVNTPEYGRVWVPSNVGPDWQPYADGRWVDTSYGYTFVSPQPWGSVVFHYGRWGWRAGLGWYWVPGYRWAPAWVSWRWVNGYAAWSPLAPRGYVYGRYWPGWVVVPHAHFTGPIRRWAVPRAQIGVIVRSARPVRTFPSYRARAFVNPRVRVHVRHGRR
jgi:uncharacterized protein DUF6600